MKLTPQDEQVLAHLRTGKSLTPLEALGVYGVFRLSARIWSINNYLEENVVLETVTKTNVTDAKGKRYARYRLTKLDRLDESSPRSIASGAIAKAKQSAPSYAFA